MPGTFLPLRTLLTGSEDPPPDSRDFSAGPLSLRYEAGTVRTIRYGTREVVRRVGIAVRDGNWNVVPLRAGGLHHEATADGFSMDFLSESARPDLPVRFRTWIRGTNRGVLEISIEGALQKPATITRLGLAVLLPVKNLAGRPCVLERANGTIAKGSFPRYVVPTTLAEGVRALSYEVAPGVCARVELKGEDFEMEDVRNWTDAAFELYWPGTRAPLPLELKEGTVVRHTFRLAIDGPSTVSRIDPAWTSVSVGASGIAPLPPIGLGSASHGRALGRLELARLKALAPAHLRVDVRPAEPQAPGTLRRAAAEAKAAACSLEVALHLGPKPEEELRAFLAAIAPGNPPVARWIVFQDGAPVPADRYALFARQVLVPFRPEARVAAGTDAHFADLNRHSPPKSAELLAFSATPQAQARDTGTLLENLEGLASTIESARLLPGDRPVVVSPITLRPRFNPNAAAGAAAEAPGELPSRVDPRQLSLLGAAWTAAALRAVSQPGVHAVTFFETSGRQGVMEREIDPPLHPAFPSRPGWAFPVYHVLADACEFAGASVLAWTQGRDLVVDGVGLSKGGRIRILLANLTGQNQKVRLACPLLRGTLHVRRLDETTAEEAMSRPEAFRARPGDPVDAGPDPLELEFLPYAVVRIDAGSPAGPGGLS